MKFLAQDQLEAFLGHLASRARVVAPIADEDRVVLFRPWSSGDPVELDVLLAKQSAKDYVFRQSETYLKFGYQMEGPAGAVDETPEEAAHHAERGRRGPRPGGPPDGQRQGPRGPGGGPGQRAPPSRSSSACGPATPAASSRWTTSSAGTAGSTSIPTTTPSARRPPCWRSPAPGPAPPASAARSGAARPGTEGVDALFTQVEGGFLVEPLTDKGEAVLDFGRPR